MSLKLMIKFIRRPAFWMLFIALAAVFLGVFWYFERFHKVVIFELDPSAENAFVEYIKSNPDGLHDVKLQKIDGYDKLWKMRIEEDPENRASG